MTLPSWKLLVSQFGLWASRIKFHSILALPLSIDDSRLSIDASRLNLVAVAPVEGAMD